jgi:hypothetical protein
LLEPRSTLCSARTDASRTIRDKQYILRAVRWLLYTVLYAGHTVLTYGRLLYALVFRQVYLKTNATNFAPCLDGVDLQTSIFWDQTETQYNTLMAIAPNCK